MTEQAADMEIPTDTCTHDIIKMLIYSIISFVEIPRDGRTMCRWIGSHFHDCINFYGVAFSAIFNRDT